MTPRPLPFLVLASWRLALSSSSVSVPGASAFAPPSWEALRATPSIADRPPPPVHYRDAPPDDVGAPEKPILYRDEACVDVASETVWLALECKNVDYRTVLVSTEEDDRVPRIAWPNDDDDDEEGEGEVETTDPERLLERIQSRYPDAPPHFYPRVSLAVDGSRCQILRLPGVMPRNAHPAFDSLAPFLFKDDGTPIRRASHKVSLEEIEEMQEEYYLGKYLCGREVCAADMVWAPYLERYAVQLPLLFPNSPACDPRSRVYPEVAAWYAAMERLPAYACAVGGDARHWRACLERAVPSHNARATEEDRRVRDVPPPPEGFGWWMRECPAGEELWAEYATEKRPWLADTPGGEAALHLIRNREDVVDSAASAMGVDVGVADEALREVIRLLLDWKMGGGSETADDRAGRVEEVSENGRRMARFASDRIRVPRDIGMVPALALGELARSIQ